MPRLTLDRKLAILFASVFGATALLFASGAVRQFRMSSWDDRESPPFDLSAGAHGRWDVQWEARGGTDRGRTALLRSIGSGEPNWPESIEMWTRVDPVEALATHQRRPAGSDWVRADVPENAGVVGIAEPTLVRRIDWRVDRVEPAVFPVRFRFLVRGDPHSEHPRHWPMFASIASMAALFAIFAARRAR